MTTEAASSESLSISVPEETPTPRKKLRRGFAAMSPEKQRSIASLGGKAAHVQGVGHEFTSEEAKVAGQKGGHAAQVARRVARASRRKNKIE